MSKNDSAFNLNENPFFSFSKGFINQNNDTLLTLINHPLKLYLTSANLSLICLGKLLTDKEAISQKDIEQYAEMILALNHQLEKSTKNLIAFDSENKVLKSKIEEYQIELYDMSNELTSSVESRQKLSVQLENHELRLLNVKDEKDKEISELISKEVLLQITCESQKSEKKQLEDQLLQLESENKELKEKLLEKEQLLSIANNKDKSTLLATKMLPLDEVTVKRKAKRGRPAIVRTIKK